LTETVHASELQVHLGGLHANPGTDQSYSWALEYRRAINDSLSASFTWLNEGHLKDNARDSHRDGQAMQLWWHTATPTRGLRYEIGIGPYYYYDTVTATNPDGYANVHGWGLLGGIGASWYFGDRYTGSLRLNRVQAPGATNSTALVAGVGYRFGGGEPRRSDGSAAPLPNAAENMEVDAMMGGTVVNSLSSETGFAKAISLRYSPSRHIGVSLTYLDEGEVDAGAAGTGLRAGIAPQVWGHDQLTPRLSVGAGLGPYFATTRLRLPDGKQASSLAILVSVTASYAISDRLTGRMTWNRVATDYSRDTDVLLLGLGYRF
jgi:hypothetical protein